jgi:alpha-tubulin suppressor-like RCC1 family protein
LPIQVTALGATVVEVAAGARHTCARKADGTLWCWGYNSRGEIGNGTTSYQLSPALVTALGDQVVQVSAGGETTCARKADLTLWCWGDNFFGQLGDGTTDSASSPVQVAALGNGVVEVSAGLHTCARKADGTMWCWGQNSAGELGDGTGCPPSPSLPSCGRSSPVQVTALDTDVVEVSTGGYDTCARRTDGHLWCWGANDKDANYGSIGDGATCALPMCGKASPTPVTALGTGVVEVAAGQSRTCARKADGTLWCWGNNFYGQLGDGTTVSRSTPQQVPLNLL